MSDNSFDRRQFVRGLGVTVAAGAIAGCSGGGGDGGGTGGENGGSGGGTDGSGGETGGGETTGDSGGGSGSGGGVPSEVSNYLSNTGNFDGSVADRTGQSEVTIQVGAEGNGGGFAFAPPAVRIDTGTTVVWEWTGNGGQHNVVAESGGDFESELVGEQGHTFEQTFDSTGVVTYFCRPHESLGMKGALIVE